MKNSKIEWTDHTFNPWIGCSKVSTGCKHCYAERQAIRWDTYKDTWSSFLRVQTSNKYWSEPRKWFEEAQKADITQKVFCGSMCDVFEDLRLLDELRLRLWILIEHTAPNLEWLLLTKRPENIINMIPAEWIEEPPTNVWYGTSIETNAYIDRGRNLAEVPAEVRFISAEPLLDELDLTKVLSTYKIDWIIVGGESQPGCRPMNLDWAYSLKAQCLQYEVCFFMKQLGGYPAKRNYLEDFPPDLRYREVPYQIETFGVISNL